MYNARRDHDMVQHTGTLTAEHLLQMPDDGRHRYELVAGRLRTMTPAGSLHGILVMRLAIALGNHVDEKRLGLIFGPDTGFKLESDPDTVRAPDVAFVAQARIPATGIPTGFWRGAPDLVVEVLSPTDVRSELEEKIEDYLRLGVEVVWFVEPSLRHVTVRRQNAPSRILTEADTLDGGALLPDFRYPLSRLFSLE